MVQAISYKGFSVMDIWGICPGRYTRKNRINRGDILRKIQSLQPYSGVVSTNERPEYVEAYRMMGEELKQPAPPIRMETQHQPPQRRKSEILFLGSAGQRVVTAGEVLCLAALSAGLQVTQKNDYDITVLKGPSVSEIILWPEEVGYTGIERPDIILVISEDGVKRRRQAFTQIGKDGLVLYAGGVEIPPCEAELICIHCKEKGLAPQNWALGVLAALADRNRAINMEMLETALEARFSGNQLEAVRSTVRKVV
jgi:Pyruvate/2-oxoacid:ferredoxin oxidoreductase gamma subunit